MRDRATEQRDAWALAGIHAGGIAAEDRDLLVALSVVAIM